MADVLNRASAQWEPRLLASIYAAAALEADDAHGREHHLVTQHYGIRYEDLMLVIAMAAETVDGQHATTGKLHRQCVRCDAVLALGRVQNAAEWTAAPGELDKR
jgi:hypothetical protein